MKVFLIYLGSFVVTTLAMALFLMGVSEERLVWRDAVIIGAVFGAVVPLTLWRWQVDRQANRRLWNVMKLIAGRR